MFKKSIYISLLSFFVSVLSFCNQLLVAYFFGAKEKIDLFFSITSFPLLLGGVLSISVSYFLIPYIKKQQLIFNELDFKKYLYFFLRDVTTKLTIVVIVFSVIVICYQKFILLIPFTTTNLILSILALLTSFFLVIISILTAFNNVEEKYFLAVLISFLPPIFSIIVIIFLNNTLSTLSIQIGFLTGAIIGTFILIKDYCFSIFSKNENKFKDSIKLFYKQMPFVVIAILSFTIYQPIDAYWGSKLGTSNVAYLGYLQRLIIAISVIVISGPTIILMPRLTEYFVKEKRSEFLNLSVKAINWVFILSVFFALVCSLLSSQIIQLLFQRAAFTEVDTFNMSQVFPIMLVGMCFMVLFTILFRIIFINGNTKKASLIGIFSTVIYFISSGFFSHFLGLKGICLAYAFTWGIVFFIAAYSIFKQFKNYFFKLEQITLICKIILLSVFVTLFFQRFINYKVNDFTFSFQLINLTWKCLIITVLFFSVGIYLLKINELIEIMKSLKSIIYNSNKKK